MIEKYTYSITTYPWKETMQDVLKVDSLEGINDKYPVFQRENDQSTTYHKMYYTYSRTDDFQEGLYKPFIKYVKDTIYGGAQIVYQKIPTFRIALPDNIAVGEYHRDRDYRNGEWANTVKEENYYLPFTRAYSTNTIWTETGEGWEDYTPLQCEYGEFYRWDASNLKHGNKQNDTGTTRVSVDFRIIPYSRYKDSDHGSINMKLPFKIGGYYELM